MINNNIYSSNNNYINMNPQKSFNDGMNNINNNNNINEKKLQKYPNKIGLENLGHSSYMNASLQCLFNIKILSKKLLHKYLTLNPNSQPLTFAYTSLLFDLKNGTSKYINPSMFKSIIGDLNPLFQGNKTSDPRELISFIIERLHQELKPLILHKKSQIDFYEQELISLNNKLSFQNFYNDMLYNISCIFDTFYGITKIERECYSCRIIKYSYQTFNMLNFILKEVKEYKIKSIGNEYYNKINIYDAFDRMEKKNHLYGENQIFCNNCNKMSNHDSNEMIFSLPPILIVVLNRGKNGQDFNEQFIFDEVLNFNNSNYVIYEKSYKKYYLCGLISRIGGISSNSHFISFCRNSVYNKFVMYNDTLVTENIEIEDAMKFKISDNDNEKVTPYILFYHYF